MKALDLTNQKFNRLTVLGKSDKKGEKVMWKCQCDCGNIIYVATCNLRGNKFKSCGCLKNEKLIQRSTKHNKCHTRLYLIWKAMKQRCYNQNNKEYNCYGGRGITICDEWKNDFKSFYDWSIQNGYKENLFIDRINNDSNYEPSNCRWADRKTQNNNTRHNHLITYDGKTLTLSQWAELYNLSYGCLKSRIKNGWSIEKALTTPTRK